MKDRKTAESGLREIQMNNYNHEKILKLAGHKREDISVCLGCKICASVCTVNDLELNVNPQALLSDLFLGREITSNHSLVRYCTSCYRCSQACPWQIRIPEIIRAIKESLGVEARFEKAFKKCIDIWGRVYEPFVILMAAPDLVRGGYLKYLPKWMEYAGFHLPHRVKHFDSKEGRS